MRCDRREPARQWCAIRPQQTKNVLPSGHLALSASALLAGAGASNALPLPSAVFLSFLHFFVIFVVHPVFHVITAALPSSFQVPVIPSARVAFATPSLDKVISKGCPAVSFTFHTPSNALAARLARLVIPIKQAAVTAALIVFLLSLIHISE